jgi:hypothetical protein
MVLARVDSRPLFFRIVPMDILSRGEGDNLARPRSHKADQGRIEAVISPVVRCVDTIK